MLLKLLKQKINLKENILFCILYWWATKSLKLNVLFIHLENAERWISKESLTSCLSPSIERFTRRGDAGSLVLCSSMRLLNKVAVNTHWMIAGSRSLLLGTASPFIEEEWKNKGSIDISSISVLTLFLLFFRIAWLVKLLIWGPEVVFDWILLPGSEWCQNRIWQMLFRLLLKTWLQITQVQ